jgi:hypothetical protein
LVAHDRDHTPHGMPDLCRYAGLVPAGRDHARDRRLL